MNPYFLAAAVLLIAIGLIHSILGERIIFRRMRTQGMIPTQGGNLLREPHVRILWATWHMASVLGWFCAAVLFWLALPSTQNVDTTFLAKALVITLLASSALVLIGTKGRHPGWVGLLAAGLLVVAGA